MDDALGSLAADDLFEGAFDGGLTKEAVDRMVCHALHVSPPRHLVVHVLGRPYTAILTPDPSLGGFTVEVPALPGVVTEADTIAEAREKVGQAIRLWLGAAVSGS